MSLFGLLRCLIPGSLACLVLMAVPVSSSGFWRRGYVANLPMPTAAAWNAPTTVPLSRPAAGADGVGAYLGTACPTPDIPRGLAALERLPLTWARTEIPWAGVEPERGRLEWEPWDTVVASLRARDYQVLGMLCYWTGWVEPYSDEALREFEKYAERVARRYRGKVRAWEIWNEPNERTFWQSTPERYVRLMQAAYQGVKRGDPDAVVVGGSLSGVDTVFLRQLLDHGGGRWMDALSVHPYSFGWGPESAQLLDELRGVAALWRREGRTGGIWVTEIGASTRAEVRQANELERIWILLRQSGVVEVAFWYCLYLDYPNGHSLYRPDWSPKPAVERLSRVVSRLQGAVPAGSGVPADLLPPWASGTPHAAVPLQSWCFQRGSVGERATWVMAGKVNGEANGKRRTLTRRPQWETLSGIRP